MDSPNRGALQERGALARNHEDKHNQHRPHGLQISPRSSNREQLPPSPSIAHFLREPPTSGLISRLSLRLVLPKTTHALHVIHCEHPLQRAVARNCGAPHFGLPTWSHTPPRRGVKIHYSLKKAAGQGHPLKHHRPLGQFLQPRNLSTDKSRFWNDPFQREPSRRQEHHLADTHHRTEGKDVVDQSSAGGVRVVVLASKKANTVSLLDGELLLPAVESAEAMRIETRLQPVRRRTAHVAKRNPRSG